MKTITIKLRNSAHGIAALLLIIMCAFTMPTATAATPTAAAKSAYFVDTNRLWLNVTGSNGAFSQTLFGYRAGATDGVDQGLDGAFWNDGALALASLIGNVRYAIQFKGLPFSQADVVPLSFSATQSGTFTFAIDHMDGFFLTSTFNVYLHDTQTNTYTNLKSGSYTFNTAAGAFNDRFQLTYSTSSANLGTTQVAFTPKSLDVWQSNHSVVVKSGNFMLSSLQVYTLTGQQLYADTTLNTNEIVIGNLNSNEQIILIRATTSNGETVTKKWLYY